MYQIHPNARTTPAVRAAIAASTESSGVLAKRYGVSTETIRKWRTRGTADVQDHSSRPQHLRWRATEEERAIVCELRRSTGFTLDDLTFTVRHFLPHLNRDSIYRILKAEGLNRLPPRPSTMPAKPTKKFKTYDLGFLHVDIKHLPKLQTADGERRKRYLYVAIDRASRMVHLAVKDEENEACASAFLKEAVAAFPFAITHVLTDNGSCFTADAFEKTCRDLGIAHRRTKPYTPKTNGMVERFNGRIGRDVLVITVGTHRSLERLLQGYNVAYNARRQRVLEGKAPNDIVKARLRRKPELANPYYRPPDDPCRLPKAMVVVERAKEVSHPDT
ncbi:IS481 family transposase [Azospirillum brasilense]|nr:IS481 family transposase [Azospirillum brasilense]